ncbi:MAG: UMP kinase [Defluviitaleaceae bacterium]|nr:UMP kinase [Defluviitaleaceae bacterium]
MYRRIVIKLSGEALSNSNNLYDDNIIDNIIEDIKSVVSKGVNVAIAVGGGNIWRGRNTQSIDKAKADQMGMLATVINSMYLCERLKSLEQDAVVFTPFSIGTFTKVYSKEATEECFAQGKVAIFGGGLGHPFFSTDTIPVLRACELNCDCIFFAKNVNGVYNKNPNIYKDAIRYKEITYREIIQKNLEAMDVAAMVLCEQNNIPSFVFSLNHPNSIEIAVTAKNKSDLDFGTLIYTNN